MAMHHNPHTKDSSYTNSFKKFKHSKSSDQHKKYYTDKRKNKEAEFY